jgi:pyridoxal phosphate-dependent aminotransferase EpsN
MSKEKILLSPPVAAGNEAIYLQDVLASNSLSVYGKYLDGLEDKMRDISGKKFVLLVNSGTSAIHLALLASGIKKNDRVAVPSFTFAGTAFPVRYCGAEPVFIDSEIKSWNMDPLLLEAAVVKSFEENRPLRAVISVDIYGNPCRSNAIKVVCEKYNLPYISDSAQSVGSVFHRKPVGADALVTAFSLNGNKIITASGGGVLATDEENIYATAKLLSNQASIPGLAYHHEKVGFNYRLSNIQAAIGLAQTEVLQDRINRRREVFDKYSRMLEGFKIVFQAEEPESYSNRWFTCILLENTELKNKISNALTAAGIENRWLMTPLYQQPVFSSCQYFSNGVAETLFERGICLPSGTNLTEDQQKKIVSLIISNL